MGSLIRLARKVIFFGKSQVKSLTFFKVKVMTWLFDDLTWLFLKFFTFFFKINLVFDEVWDKGRYFSQIWSFDTFVGKKVKSSHRKVKSMTWLSAQKKKSMTWLDFCFLNKKSQSYDFGLTWLCDLPRKSGLVITKKYECSANDFVVLERSLFGIFYFFFRS